MAADYISIKSPIPLAYFKGNIVAIYHYNHKTFRYNLMKVDEKCYLPKVKGLRIMPDKYDAAFEVERIEALATKVNTAIIELLKGMAKEDSLTKKKIDALITSDIEPKKPESAVKAESFIKDFESWIEKFREKKRQEEVMRGLTPRKNHPTVKDYVSALNLLKDFQYDEFDGKAFRFQDIDMKFIEKLIVYAYDTRGDDDDEDASAEIDSGGSEEHKYYTKGGLSNKTMNKRLDCMFTFMQHFYKGFPNDIEKRPKLETVEKKIIRLDRDELRQLEDLIIKDEHKSLRYEYYRDCLVFLCYTGLRFGDFYKLDRSYYHKEGNLIVLETEKTRKHCEIYLFDKAKEIAEKHNFDFKPIYNQTLNRGIKELLEAYNLFPEEISIEYMGAGGRQTIVKKKRDFISCHTGRRTYMSIMIENGLDIYDLISTTGHALNSPSLKRYIDLFGKQRKEKFRNMNEKLK